MHHALGEVGSIIELTDEEFAKLAFNSRLQVWDSVEYEEVRESIEEKKDKEDLFDELVNIVGFSVKRANKVLGVFKSKEELLNGLSDLPFEKIENDLLLKTYQKKKKKSKEVKEDGIN